MNKLWAFIITGIFLSGCAFDTLDKGLPLLQGQKIDTAVSYFGPPDKEQNFGDKKYYTWQRHIQSTITLPKKTSTTGYVAGRYVSATSTTWEDEPFNYDCDVKITTNKKGIIEETNYEGNDAGCEYFARKIKKIIEDHKP